MTAVKYLKLDYAMIKGYLKFYLLFPVIFLAFGIWNSAAFALNYLFFFVIIVSATPFSLEGTEKSDRLYRMLPGKRNSMVLGRYLFLLCTSGVVVAADLLAVLFLYPTQRITVPEIFSLLLSAAVGLLLCFVQYPIYYKFGYEKGRISSMLVYMIPAFIVFALPGIFEGLLKEPEIHSIIVDIKGNSVILTAALIVLIGLSGVASYDVSCRFVRSKEI